jgi:hypothetical protein
MPHVRGGGLGYAGRNHWIGAQPRDDLQPPGVMDNF